LNEQCRISWLALHEENQTMTDETSAAPEQSAHNQSVLTAARRSLHAIAECVLAGPEWRAVRRFQLRVTPRGFATIESPVVRVEGMELVIDENRRVPLIGTIAAIGAASGIDVGKPADVYTDGSDLADDEAVQLDPAATRLLQQWFVLGDAALRVFEPAEIPTLWPEHFDVAVEPADTTYGASPGDAYSPVPYAYVSTANKTDDPFWNAPFGAVVPYDEAPTIDALIAFWRHGHSLLS
jgi:hypothetical protein